MAARGTIASFICWLDQEVLPESFSMFLLVFIHKIFRGLIMTEAVLDLKRWGNSLGLRLPTAVVRAAHLHVDQRVRISVEGDHVLIKPIGDAYLNLEQRLVCFDPTRHGGEAMSVSGSLGAERW